MEADSVSVDRGRRVGDVEQPSGMGRTSPNPSVAQHCTGQTLTVVTLPNIGPTVALQVNLVLLKI